MFFKKLRSRSKSSSKSTKPSIDRVTSSSSTTHQETIREVKVPAVTVSGPAAGEEGEETSDYKAFLEKARWDAERKEKETVRSIMKARETNLSPWAGRIVCQLEVRVLGWHTGKRMQDQHDLVLVDRLSTSNINPFDQVSMPFFSIPTPTGSVRSQIEAQ
ncbi:uncharacterized protein LY89DRAFT_742074 [Mollisia scopiformis]|uniref:Uncharacterized protein n=1 Tax=Mollisia scopiformis TaxID=149040 RepID=A0A132B746_MOLSC|nr:uncharacterized protein LY89DRAFT_742074 [Mollisia scopiformis]KUJ08235.1 hypothetical protein LY89DRAFT_742074 [Mollisia scopiformis]